MLELFQGPTLAFKDFALQLLGRLSIMCLRVEVRKWSLWAPPPAIPGVRQSRVVDDENIDIFILHPHERVSEVQRRQMTTVIAPNIHNLAIQGNFDDCQAMVKAALLQSPSYPMADVLLRLIRSIGLASWLRLFTTFTRARLGRLDAPTSFSVPTGNFGDIFAGYLAKKMGLPVEKLVIATNKNDVLHRVLTEGVYSRLSLEPTLSPSMDITVSSNFERLLFDLAGRDGEELSRWMATFAEGGLALSKEALEQTKSMFDSHRCSDDETCEEIAQIWANNGYLIDPHTAIGTKAS